MINYSYFLSSSSIIIDVAITNAYILMKSSRRSFKDFKSFQLQLAKDLIGEYCSRRHRGRGGTDTSIIINTISTFQPRF